jgi:phage terminase small subunit
MKQNKNRNELSPIQEMFCREYVVDLNATQAAIRAGYTRTTAEKKASSWVAKVGIQTRIAELQSATKKKLELDHKWVLSRLMRVVERCMQVEPITDHAGNETGRFRFDASGANRALELLGRHLGTFPDKHIISGNDDEKKRYSSMIIVRPSEAAKIDAQFR